MKRVPMPSARSLAFLALCWVPAACGRADSPAITGTGGEAGGGSGSAGGTTGTGGAAGTGGSAGGGSDGATPGSGGTTAADGGPSDADADADAGTGTGADLAPPGATGTQNDPGADGDGRINQPGPYMNAPETVSRMPGVPAGTVTDKAYYASKAVYPDRKFKYSIYVPSQYRPGKRAALMVFQDARHYDGTDSYKFNVAITFDNLIARGDMPVTIAVMIDPGTPSGDYIAGGTDNQTYRSPEYDRSNGNYAKFLIDEFLTDVVLPKYDIVQDADGWAVAGHSSGGSCALAVAWNRTEAFHKVHTNNGSFNLIRDAFPGQINTMPAKPIRIYMNSGTGDMAGWMPANDAMGVAFAAKKYHYRYRYGTGTHDPPTAGLADFADSLKWLWRGYQLPWYP